MRKFKIQKDLIFILILSLSLSAGLMGLDTATETEQLKSEVVEMAEKTLPQKKKELKTKTYTGSIDEVLSARVVDVNEVVVLCDDIQTKAKDVCERLGYTENKKNAIKSLIKNKSKQDDLKKQKDNVELLAAVVQMLDEVTPDVNDPNYVEIVRSNDEFMLAVLEVVKPI